MSEIRPLTVSAIICRQWIVIALAFALPSIAERLPGLHNSPLRMPVLICAWLLAFFVIACKQHALIILMHDATHYRLFKGRSYNEWMSNYFCAFPVGMITSSYRRGHLPHHMFTNGSMDPYWARLAKDDEYRFPMRRQTFRTLVMRDIFGLNVARWWPTLRAWTGWAFVLRDRERFLPIAERLQFIVFWAVVVLTTSMTNTWAYLLLWIVPLFTLVLAFNRVRIVAEHDLDIQHDELARTRHVDGSWFERLTFAPLNINYHLAHHLFPSVPLYNLPKMHAVLESDPEFVAGALIWKRYLGRRGSIVGSLLT